MNPSPVGIKSDVVCLDLASTSSGTFGEVHVWMLLGFLISDVLGSDVAEESG
jgi:hypothetical protein